MEKQDLQQASATLVEQLTEWLQHAGEFAQEQAPDIIAQMLEWGAFSYFWVGVTLSVIAVLALVVGLVAIYDDLEAGFGVLGFVGLPCLGLSIYNWYGYFYVTKFPKLYLLSELKGLL